MKLQNFSSINELKKIVTLTTDLTILSTIYLKGGVHQSQRSSYQTVQSGSRKWLCSMKESVFAHLFTVIDEKKPR